MSISVTLIVLELLHLFIMRWVVDFIYRKFQICRVLGIFACDHLQRPALLCHERGRQSFVSTPYTRRFLIYDSLQINLFSSYGQPAPRD